MFISPKCLFDYKFTKIIISQLQPVTDQSLFLAGNSVFRCLCLPLPLLKSWSKKTLEPFWKMIVCGVSG